MRRVIIESPFAGDVEANTHYLRACLRYALLEGFAPFASHGLYTLPGVLDDLDPSERHLGMQAGFAWHGSAHEIWACFDLGVSKGMLEGLKSSILLCRDVYLVRGVLEGCPTRVRLSGSQLSWVTNGSSPFEVLD